jgi:photosystem II stability/assembly factor-like uncharacterized protein
MRHATAVALACVAALLAPGAAFAASTAPSVLPGFGDQDASAAGGAGVLYDDGYASADGGLTWSEVAGGAWLSVALDPADARHTFVYRLAGGLEESHDAGRTWTALDVASCGVVPGSAARVLADPVRVGTLYLASDAEGSIAICRSDDGGASWARAGVSSVSPLLVAPPPLARAELVALRSVAGAVVLERSSDGGVSWATTATDLPAAVASDLVDICGPGTSSCRLFGNPAHPGWLVLSYSAIDRWTSPDGGVHWTQTKLDPYGDAFRATGWLAAIGRPNVILATADDGLWRSVDGGLTYHRSLELVGGVRLVQDTVGALFVLGARDAIASYDGGATWDPHGSAARELPPAPAGQPPTLTANAQGTVFAGTFAGIYRFVATTDGWLPMSLDRAPSVGAVALGHSTILVIRAVPGDRSALARSDDGGASWTYPTLPGCRGTGASPIGDFTRLAVAPGTRTVYLESACPNWDILRSRDGGVSWRRSGAVPDDQASTQPIVTVAGRATILYHASRSDDGGTTWRPLRGVTRIHGSVVAASARAIYVLSRNASSVLAFSGDGRTRLGRVPAVLAGTTTVLVDPRRPLRAFVATTVGSGSGSLPTLLGTLDGGRRWHRIALDGARPGCSAASATMLPAHVLVSLGEGDHCAGLVLETAG